MLDQLSLIDASGNRLYLLEKTQHLIGGFGKGVGELPGKTSLLSLFLKILTASCQSRSSPLLLGTGQSCAAQ